MIFDEFLTCLFGSELYDLPDEAPSFRLSGGPNSRIQSGFRKPISSFTLGSSDDHKDMLSSYSSFTLKELMSDALFEGANKEEFEKLAFLFSDSILILVESLFEDECKWLRQMGDVKIFIPEMARSCL